jgi:membrane-bound lytic murein transglycosylase F
MPFLNKSTGVVLSVILLGVMFYSCENDQLNDGESNPNPLNIQILEPVNRSFQDIREEGVIRIITRFNSLSYFLHRGEEHGFEFELVKAFADQYDLDVEVIITNDQQDPIDLLNSGQGDVIAANYAVTDLRKHYITFTQPYNLVDQRVVLFDMDTTSVKTLADLNGESITVRNNSSYEQKLKTLIKEQGLNIEIETVSEDWDTEALITGVANGEFRATVSDDNLLKAAQTYIDNVAAGPVISEADSVAWGIRRNDPKLKKAMNRFLSKQFRITNGEPKRSALLNILMRKYYENYTNVNSYRTAIYETKYAGVLSPYDELIRPLADSAGIDWKMVISIAAQESKFDPNAKSWAGAVGLMQINHRFSPYSEAELYDPEINVKESLRIIRESMDHYAYLDSAQVWPFVLATYNAGVGHVSDARRVAMDRYRDPNDWENLSDGLLKLMKRRFYQNARHGFARGTETVNYVRGVMNRHEMYNTILQLSERSEASGIPVMYESDRVVQ